MSITSNSSLKSEERSAGSEQPIILGIDHYPAWVEDLIRLAQEGQGDAYVESLISPDKVIVRFNVEGWMTLGTSALVGATKVFLVFSKKKAGVV